MPLLPGMVRNLLEVEDNPIRFERLCTSLYKEAEGVELVSTSRTWDLGRDARAISIQRGGKSIPGVLCASLSHDIDAKVRADVQRLAGGTFTTAIVYCSSRSLSEALCDQLESKIRKIYPSVQAVRVLGQLQISDLAERFEPIFRAHYSAEIATIEQALLAPMQLPSAENLGLRLALLSQVGDDAVALRSELAGRLVLDALAGGPKTIAGMAVTISGTLHLPRTLSSGYLGAIVNDLEVKRLVASSEGSIALTEAGVALTKRIPPEASSRLLKGKIAIRVAIKNLSGHVMTDSQYERVWRTLQEGLSDLFYSQGATIIHMVAAILGDSANVPEPTDRVLFESLGDRIAALFSDRDQGAEVRQAVIDIWVFRGISGLKRNS